MALKINTISPNEINVVKNGTTTSLNVYEYSTKGSDLGEATRSSVSSYTSTQLNSWVGLENDTWGAITNASSLVFGNYYYIRVYVSDTGKYGKFCVKFKSASGTTITVDNMGWGYDGEVIYSTPVWGKPFSLTLSVGTNTSLTVKRTSSPNQNASLTSLASGEKVYYGDVLSITAKPASGYKLLLFIINGTNYGSGQTSAVTKTITVTGAVTVKCTTEAAASWQTVWTGSQGVAAFIWKTTASGTKTKTLSNGTPTGIDWSLPTKITGTAACYNNGVQSQTTATITDLELSDGVSNLLHTKSGYVGNYLVGVSISIQRNASTPNAVVTGSCSKAPGARVIAGGSLTLTEVKQYY